LIDNTPLRWVLFTVFAATAVYYLIKAVTPAPVADRVSCGWHAVMSVAMVSMLWTWGMSTPPVLGILVFSAAALWFVFLALFGTPTAGVGAHRIHRSAWYHVAMMASMVWMSVSMSMSDTMTGGVIHSDAAGASMAGMAEMPGMDMSAASLPAAGPPSWIAYISLGSAVLYLVATAWFVSALVRSFTQSPAAGAAHQGNLIGCGASALMAAGMAAFFFASA
jgi:hypothetical protein